MSRTFLTMALLVTIGMPVVAQEKKAAGPAVTFQIQPLDRILKDVKSIVQKVGGADAVKAFEQKLKEEVGGNDFKGIDQTKMFGGYVSRMDDAETVGAIAMIPVTSEKEFLDLLKRLKFEVTELKSSKGLIEATPPEGGDEDLKPVRMRFKNGYVYVALNVPDEDLDSKKLLPIKDVVDSADKNLMLIQAHLQHYSKDYKQKMLDRLDQSSRLIEGLTGSPQAKDALGVFYKYLARVTEQQYSEGDVYTVTVNIDPNTLSLTVDTALTGLKGSQLAKDIESMKPSTNQFAGLLPAQTAFGIKARFPLFAPEIRTAIELLLKEANTSTADAGPEELQPLKKEAFQGLMRTVKAGNFDVAVAVVGPDANGKFGANLGLSFGDTTALDRELRKFYKTVPDGLKSLIKLDADKVGEVSIHKADLVGFVPQEAAQFLGDEVSVCLALAPKGVYVTVGKNALPQMKAALQAKPESAKVLDIVANMNRVAKLVSKVNPDAGRELEKMSSKDDQLATIFSFAVDGGSALKFGVTFNLKPFAALVGARTAPAAEKE